MTPEERIEKYPLVCFDLETTGFSPKTEHILEACAIEFNLQGETGEVLADMCYPPSGFIPEDVSKKVHGIYIKDVEGMPPFFDENNKNNDARSKYAAFMKGRKILGHNTPFDVNFARFDLEQLKKEDRIIDTLKMCREKYRNGNKLKFACIRIGIAWDDEKAHRAEYDVRKTIELYLRMMNGPGVESTKPTTDDVQNDLFDLKKTTEEDVMKKLGIVPTDQHRKLLETMAYSYSRLSKFDQCPHLWEQEYIQKNKPPNYDFFQTGNACHSVAEWAGEWCSKHLFANKFIAYTNKIGMALSEDTKSSLALVFQMQKALVTVKKWALYLYENPAVIKDYFPDVKGRAGMVWEMDSKLEIGDYENVSMPDWDTYKYFIDTAINQEKVTEPDIVNEVNKIMARFYELDDFSLLPGDVTVTEKKLAFDKDWGLVSNFFAKNIFFRGILDVIDFFGDYVVITDYKSSRKMLNQKQLKEDRQTKIYVLLIYKLLPKGSYSKIKVQIKYLRFAKTVSYELTYDEVVQVAENSLKWINDKIQEIEGELLKTDGTAFSPKRNEYCGTCHIGEACPLFDKSKINDIEDPQKFKVSDVEDCSLAWKHVEIRKKEISRLQSQCKAFVKSCSNPIKIDDNAFLDFYTKESRKYKADEVIKLLMKKEVDIKFIAKFLSVSQSSLDALCDIKNIKLTDEEMDSISDKKIETKFEAFTKKEAEDKKYIN